MRLINLDLRTRIVGLELEHPVMNASGILGSEPEHVDILVEYGFSAIVSKSFTVEPRAGYNPPIVVELRNGGLLNAVGLANPGSVGIRGFIERAKRCGKPVVISIAGGSVEEFISLASVVEENGGDALELNLSCPHVKGLGFEIGSNPTAVFKLVELVSSTVKTPVIAKLGLCDKLVEVAGKALEAGARALTLINTIKAIAIDVYSAKPILTNVYGGLSGPPIHPIAVRAVYDVYKEYGAEIIGCGGVSSWVDAAELILAGARAVQVGTAVYRDRYVVRNILEGLTRWLETIGESSIERMIGAVFRK